jgi:sodium/potassium-transporting ATPase subunit beta
MGALLSTITDDHPKYQLEESIIGTNPGLGMRPLVENTEHGEVIIRYNPANQENVKEWRNVLDNFLHEGKH